EGPAHLGRVAPDDLQDLLAQHAEAFRKRAAEHGREGEQEEGPQRAAEAWQLLPPPARYAALVLDRWRARQAEGVPELGEGRFAPQFGEFGEPLPVLLLAKVLGPAAGRAPQARPRGPPAGPHPPPPPRGAAGPAW